MMSFDKSDIRFVLSIFENRNLYCLGILFLPRPFLLATYFSNVQRINNGQSNALIYAMKRKTKKRDIMCQ